MEPEFAPFTTIEEIEALRGLLLKEAANASNAWLIGDDRYAQECIRKGRLAATLQYLCGRANLGAAPAAVVCTLPADAPSIEAAIREARRVGAEPVLVCPPHWGFGQAFAECRKLLGRGCHFRWHGEEFTTNRADDPLPSATDAALLQGMIREAVLDPGMDPGDMAVRAGETVLIHVEQLTEPGPAAAQPADACRGDKLPLGSPVLDVAPMPAPDHTPPAAPGGRGPDPLGLLWGEDPRSDGVPLVEPGGWGAHMDAADKEVPGEFGAQAPLELPDQEAGQAGTFGNLPPGAILQPLPAQPPGPRPAPLSWEEGLRRLAALERGEDPAET